jgi:hypothetical protein
MIVIGAVELAPEDTTRLVLIDTQWRCSGPA